MLENSLSWKSCIFFCGQLCVSSMTNEDSNANYYFQQSCSSFSVTFALTGIAFLSVYYLCGIFCQENLQPSRLCNMLIISAL